MVSNSSETIHTSQLALAPDAESPIGPPGWSQLIYISFGNPFYVPNPFVICAGIWLLCCIFTSIWARIAIHRNKGKTPIIQSLAGWRYRLATTVAILAFSWAVFDDTYRIVNEWVEQRLFLAQFIGDFCWDTAKILLLLCIHDLHFHLMRQSPLGSWKVCQMHFWRYTTVRVAYCGVLMLLAFLMMCLRIAHLSFAVNHPAPPTMENPLYRHDSAEAAAVFMCYIFDSLYFLAGLEVLVVASVLLSNRRSKIGSGSTSMLTSNLILITTPLFLAATFTLISTSILAPPQTYTSNSFGPTTNDGFHAALASVHFTAVLLAGIGVVLPLGGIVTVAKQADATMDRIERLTSESLDQVLVGGAAAVSHVSMEQTRSGVESHPQPRPASSNYDDPESWGGSTRRPSYVV